MTSLHGVGFKSCPRTVSGERTLYGPVRIDEVGVVVFHDIHHAQGPLGGIPFGVIQVVVENMPAGWRRPILTPLFRPHAFVFAQVECHRASEGRILPTICPCRRPVSDYHRRVLPFIVAVLVAAEGGLPPPPGVFMMERYAVVHPIGTASLGPFAQKCRVSGQC